MSQISDINRTLHSAVRDDLVRLGRALKARRVERGLTQQQLAERLGIAVRTLRAIESGSDTVNIGIVASAMMMLDLGSLTALIQQQTPQLLSSTRSRVSAGKTRPDYDDF